MYGMTRQLQSNWRDGADNDLLAQYRQYMFDGGYSPNSIRLYVRVARQYLTQRQASLAVHDAEPLRFLGGCKSTSQGVMLSSLQHFIRFAGLHCDWPKPPPRTMPRPVVLEPDALAQLSDAIDRMDDTRLAVIFFLMVDACARLSECEALLVTDISIVNSLLVVSLGKGEQRRDIPIGAQGSQSILKWIDVRKTYEPPQGCRRLLLNASGQPLSKHGIIHLLKSIEAKTAISLSPQLLRNTGLRQRMIAAQTLTELRPYAGYSSYKREKLMMRMLPASAFSRLIERSDSD